MLKLTKINFYNVNFLFYPVDIKYLRQTCIKRISHTSVIQYFNYDHYFFKNEGKKWTGKGMEIRKGDGERELENGVGKGDEGMGNGEWGRSVREREQLSVLLPPLSARLVCYVFN